jgi:hypothetical protein
MDLLRENDLIYGRLLTVDEPHLIERYNKALAAFGLKPTKLKSFEIDRTGFSPQIADELKDPLYLDPNEINRRFIILTPRRPICRWCTRRSPTPRSLCTSSIRPTARHRRADHQGRHLRRDRGLGSKVDDIEDLLSINQVEFRVLSAEDTLGKAAELGTLVDRLKLEPDAWRDDAMLERMVELARSPATSARTRWCQTR